jgi:hypothetical protein
MKTIRDLLFHTDARGSFTIPAGSVCAPLNPSDLPIGLKEWALRRLAADRKAGKDPVLVELAGQARVLERADIEERSEA